MPNIISKADWLGNPEIPYECRYCPNCEAINWSPGRNPISLGEFEIDGIQCWQCNAKFWIQYGYEDNCYGNMCNADDDNIVICKGMPDPVIPIHILKNLVDAAEEQSKDLHKMILAGEDATELERMINIIQNSIDYVKQLITRGGIKDLKEFHNS